MPASAEESPTTVVVEAYSARLALCAPDPTVMERMTSALPPGWAICSTDATDESIPWRFAVAGHDGAYRVTDGSDGETSCAEFETVMLKLRAELRRFVGHHAVDRVFVHAGVVAVEGRALLLPGHSFAGKSTLVAALVRAGADYYSDEYAIFDACGLVSQYLEPIVLRTQGEDEAVPADPVQSQPPAPVALVALATYQPGASWSPVRLTTAAGVVAVTEHALPARERPAETIATLRAALADAVILEGWRGEADEAARALIAELAGR